MKHTTMWTLPLLVAQAGAAALAGRNIDGSELDFDAAPSPAPAGVMKDALKFTFAIENFDYYDLSKTTCPKKVGADHHSASSGSASAHQTLGTEDDDDEDPTLAEKAWDNSIGKVENGIGNTIETVESVKPNFPPPPWMKNKGGALLQANACVLTRRSLKAKKGKSKHCETVMDVFRNGIHEVVTDIVTCMSIEDAQQEFELDHTSKTQKKGPAPAKVFLQNPASPAPAPMPAALSASGAVDVLVSLLPGKPVGDGASIIAEVAIVNYVGADLGAIWDLLQHAIDDGALEKEIEQALQLLSGMAPKLTGFTLSQTKIAAWNMAKCEGHVKKIVNDFAKTYSKERVPMALYNECTNFVTKISFSHDHVLDPRDTLACRETTASFAKHWKGGEKAKDYDFEHMCRRACEVKFGEKAHMCMGAAAGPGPAPAPAPAKK